VIDLDEAFSTLMTAFHMPSPTAILTGLKGTGMSSDTDDLQEALRQNLKLRRELAKRAKPGGGVAYGFFTGRADVGWAAVITPPETTTASRGLNLPWLGVPAMELPLANLNVR
jgi:hypothetical protein